MIESVISHPAAVVVNEQGQEERYTSDERPCPTCRFAIQKNTIFQRSAFEPSDAELNQGGGQANPTIIGSDVDNDDEDGMPIDPDVMLVKKENQSDDEDAGKITASKARGSRNKTRRRSYADLDSDYEDDYDDDDSFIVNTDEDDDLPKRSTKRKRNVVFSDNEDEVLLPPKVVKRRTRKMKGERRKFLPSTKLKVCELLTALAYVFYWLHICRG